MNWSEVISNLLHPTHSCETVHTLISVLSFLLNPDAWFSANLAHNSIWAWGSRTKVQMLFFHISCLSVFYSGSRSWGEAGQADPLLPQGSLVVLRCSFSSFLKRVSFSILSISDSLDTSLMLAGLIMCMLPASGWDCLFKTEEAEMLGVQDRDTGWMWKISLCTVGMCVWVFFLPDFLKCFRENKDLKTATV